MYEDSIGGSSSPRFTFRGRRLKDDCHLSGWRPGEARRKMSERAGEKKEEGNAVRHAGELARGGKG